MLMKRFTTDHLTTFAAVIEHGTFDAAAEALRVSPSAISQRIKVMEQLAGKVLLRRTNPVTPTQAGQSPERRFPRNMVPGGGTYARPRRRNILRLTP